jgi:hypothetical protein
MSRIDKHGHTSGGRDQLSQEFQPLSGQLGRKKIDSGCVATRSGEAGDKTEPDRVFGGEEDDGDRRGCRLGQNSYIITGRDDRRDLTADQIGRQCR